MLQSRRVIFVEVSFDCPNYVRVIVDWPGYCIELFRYSCACSVRNRNDQVSPMPSLLIHDADCIATQDDVLGELRRASLFVRDNRIEWIGAAEEVPPQLVASANETIDARGHVVLPGLVNTHHHMFQSLTRAVPLVQDARVIQLAEGTLSDLGRIDPGNDPGFYPDCQRRIAVVGLYGEQRSFVHIPEWLAA